MIDTEMKKKRKKKGLSKEPNKKNTQKFSANTNCHTIATIEQRKCILSNINDRSWTLHPLIRLNEQFHNKRIHFNCDIRVLDPWICNPFIRLGNRTPFILSLYFDF